MKDRSGVRWRRRRREREEERGIWGTEWTRDEERGREREGGWEREG